MSTLSPSQSFNHRAVAQADPFISSGTGALIPVRAIEYIDTANVEQGVIAVFHRLDDKVIETRLEGIQAIEALMLVKPSAMEGKRMHWARQAWLVHNTVGHGYLALVSALAWGIKGMSPDTARRLVRHGIYVHDATCPAPHARP